jgi:hypothetical protein
LGIFDRQERIAEYNPATGFPQSTQISGLFTPSTLALAIFPDADSSLFPVDAATALTVPAVQRGLQIFSSVGSRLPLLATDADGNAVDLPFLTTTQGAITPQKRTASVIQDLIFHNHSVLQVERDGDGYITAAEHLPVGYWTMDAQGFICINNKRVDQNSVVYIPSLMPMGFLEVARDSIRQYRNITQTINNRTAAPEPVILIKETQESGSQPEEIDDAIEALTNALTSKRGGIVFQPYGLEISGFGSTDSANSLMLEARNALRVDVANHLGLSAALLDGSGGGNSDVYQNAVDERNELAELSLKTWTEPIADRLSQDDCTPPGVKVSVDYSSFRSHVSGKTNQESPVIPND